MDTNWKDTENKPMSGRAKRGGLPLLLAMMLGFSLLLHGFALLLLGGWHGLADFEYLRGDLARYPDYARAMSDLYRAVAVCVAGAGDAMGQPTGEVTIINRDEAKVFDAAMQQPDAGTGEYWETDQVNLGLSGEEAEEEMREYLGSILETDGRNGIGQVGIAVIGPDGKLQADYPVASPFHEDGTPAVPSGWRLELYWDGKTLTAANDKILAAYQDTPYDIRPLEEQMADTRIAIITRSWDSTDGLLSSWYFSNISLRAPAHSASIDHALSVLCLCEGAAGLLLILPGLIFRRRRIAGAESLARFTGWFLVEFKIVMLAAAVLLGMVLLTSFIDNYWYLTQLSVTVLGLLCLLIVTTAAFLLTDLIHNGGAVFQNNLFQLGRRAIGTMTANSPLERRLSVRIWLSVLPAIVGGAGILLFFPMLIFGGNGAGLVLLLLCVLLIPVGGILLLLTALRSSRRMGQMAKQVSDLAAGGEAQPLSLPRTDPFIPLQQDLVSLQQGVRRAVEAQLRSERISMQSERMKVELIANVSHDLKTPLTSVVNYADLLCEERLASPADHYAQVLREKAYRLKTMVQDVFDISKAASGNIQIRKTEKGYEIHALKETEITAQLSGRGETDDLLAVKFHVKNQNLQRDMYIRLEGQTNRLSAEKGYEYANKNQDFSYTVTTEKQKDKAVFIFGKGSYIIEDIQIFTGNLEELREEKLCENPLEGIWFSEGGDRLTGAVRTEKQGYLITSIPYDKNFKITVDGENVEKKKVNTAFLGAKIPKGVHSISISYQAPGKNAGLFLTGGGLVCLAVLVMGRLCRRLLAGCWERNLVNRKLP